MKILLIHNFYRNYSGEDTYIVSLSKLLKKRGHTVVMYTKHNRSIKNTFWEKVCISLGLFWNYRVEKELSSLIQKHRPDVAQIQNIYPLISPTVYPICKKYGVWIVQRVSNYRFFCPKATLFRNGKICERCIKKTFFYPSVYYACYNGSRLASLVFSLSLYFHRLVNTFVNIDRFVFPSVFTHRFYQRTSSLFRGKSYVIPTFSSMSFQPKKESMGKYEKYFLFVGQLTEEKGIIPLLNLFSKLPDLNLIVVGTGPLKDRIKTFKAYKNIHIIGFRSRRNILSLMKNAIATVVPSLWYDVLPNVVLESLFQGTPVIAPRTASFIELIKHKENGLFYKQNNLKDLEKKLLWINKRRLWKEKAQKLQSAHLFNQYTEQQHYFSLFSHVYPKI